MCDVSASYVIELKLVDSGYKFLWPFVAVLIICMCVMVTFTVSLHTFVTHHIKYWPTLAVILISAEIIFNVQQNLCRSGNYLHWPVSESVVSS